VFLDRVDNTFYLGIASSRWGWGQLLAARVIRQQMRDQSSAS
jgi:hypothetical protein